MQHLKANELYQWIITPSSAIPSQYFHQDVIRFYNNDGQSIITTQNEQYRVIRLILPSETSAQQLTSILLDIKEPIYLKKIERQLDLLCVEAIISCSIYQSLSSKLETINDLEIIPFCLDFPYLTTAGLLVMDMDSTAIEIECIDELAKIAGVGNKVAQVTEQAMNGELDFEQSLRLRVAQLANTNTEAIEKVCAELPLMPGLENMVKELQSYGWKIALASGGFTPFVNTLKQQLNLSAAFANELEIKNNHITGNLLGNIVDAQYKAKLVTQLESKWSIPHSQSMAIGDGANDIPMLKIAALGIAFHGKDSLKNNANICINNLDLSAIPYCLQ